MEEELLNPFKGNHAQSKSIYSKSEQNEPCCHFSEKAYEVSSCIFFFLPRLWKWKSG